MDLERRIRERAHQIWEEEGRPLGRDHEHWERARREVTGNVIGSKLVGADDALATGDTPPDALSGDDLGVPGNKLDNDRDAVPAGTPPGKRYLP